MSNFRIHGLSLVLLASLLAVAASGGPLTITTNGGLGTYPIGQDQIPLNASGGSGNYTWSLASGSLPTGLNIAPIPGSLPVQIGLVGIASAAGSYSFSLTVNDGTTSLTQAFTAKITALTLKDPNLPDAFLNTFYSYSFTALNNAGPVTFAVTSPALPARLTLSSTGVLSGTPTAAGTYNINFSISDGVDTSYRGFQLLVYTINLTTPGVLPNATQGVSYSAGLAASGGAGGYQYAITGGSLPPGLSLSSGGAFSGTTSGGTGIYWFYVTVTDSAHNSYQKTMTIDVLGPTIAQNQVTLGTIDDAVVGQTYGWQIPTCCGGTAPFTWTASGLPTGMSIRWGSGVTSDYIAPGWGEIWGLATTPGNYTVTVTVTDSLGATASLTFPFHVSVLSLAPYYNLQSGTINSPYSTAFQIIGGSPSYSVTQIGGYLPDGLALNTASAATGNFSVTGTPVENGGFDPVFKVTDGSGNTLTRNNYFNINNVPGGITINNNSSLGSFTIGQFFSIQLSACCVANYVWSATPGSLPSGLTLSTSGQLGGTVSTSGTYTFLVEAADAAGVAAPGFREFILNASPLSITTNSIPYGNVGSTYNSALAATGGTGTLTWSVAFGSYLPAGLSLTASGTAGATLSGIPTETGQYNFGVTVADQSGHTSTRYYGIDIYAAGTFPPVTFGNGPNFGTWHLGTDTVALAANGGNGTYTWTLVSGTLPPGLALRTDVPTYFSSNSQAGLIGVATTPGPYNFTLKVTSAGQSLSQAFTIEISKLDLQNVNPPDGFVSTPFSYTFTPIGNAGAVTFTVNSNSTNGAMPPGLTLSSAGVLSGTPTTAGDYIIAMNIFDGVDTQYEQYNLYIYAINITTPGVLPNGTQNSSYSTTIAATGGTLVGSAGYNFTLSGGLPAGLNLSPTGTISGTITAGPGLYGFTITATDSNQVSYSKNMALDVIGYPIAPMRITNLTFNDPVFGDRYGNVQGVCCGGTAPFTWTVTGLPPGLTFEPNSNSYLQYGATPGNLQIYGVPQQAGTFNVQFTVTDNNGASTTATVPMHVSTLDVALPSNYGAYNLPIGTVNIPYSATFRVLGGTPPYSFTKTINGELPDALTINSSTLTVSGTPLENGSNFNAPGFLFQDSGGNTLFRYESISISGGTSTITINGDGYYGYNLGTTPVGVSYSTQFSACCVPTYSWSVAAGSTLPPGLSLSSSGQLSGTPTTPGTYTFLVDAADATNSANVGVKSFVLTVTPISITTSSLPYGDVGTPYSTTLTATGGTSSLTWTLTFGQGTLLPPGLTLSPAGLISGMPTSAGAYTITVQASDSSGNIAIRGFTIDVYQSGPPPLNLPVGPNFGPNFLGGLTIALQATGGQPPYVYSLTPAATPIAGMRVITGQPLPTFFSTAATGGYIGVITTPGTYSTSLRVTDALNNIYDRAITITVSPLNFLISDGNLPSPSVGSPYSFTFPPSGGSGNYSWTAAQLPPGITINGATGTISGTPTAAGTFSAQITLTDISNSNQLTGGFNITVNPFAITTSGELPSGTIGTAYSQTLSAPSCGSGCTWTLISGGLPGGLSLSSTGVISGTPTNTQTNTLTIQASGSNGTVQEVFSLQIVNNTPQPLFITNGPIVCCNSGLGAGYSLGLFAEGGTPPYSWSVSTGALPTGITIQGLGQNLSRDFGPGITYLSGKMLQVGLYSFTLKVTDAANNTATQAFTWNVSPLWWEYTDFPIAGGTSLTYNTAYSQQILVMGGSGVYSTWAPVTPMPPGLSINSNTGLISGTPTNTGFFSSQIQVTDSVGNTSAPNLQFNIAGPTSTLVNFNAGPNLGTYQQGFTSQINLNPSGGTGPYTITQLTPLPAGFAIETGSSLFSSSPGNYVLAFQPLTTGTFSFTLQVQDSLGNIGVRTFTIVISPFSLYTTTLNDASVGVAYSSQIPVWDNTGTVTFSVNPSSAMPAGLAVSSGGLISGTPTQAGTFSFTLIETDGSGATVNIGFSLRVSHISIAGAPILPTVTAGVPYTYTFTATGGLSTLTWSATGLPSGITLSGSGVLSGTTTSTGFVALVVTATDGVVPVSRRFTLFLVLPNPGELGFSTSGTALSDATVGQSYVSGLNPSGGSPPYTWSVASGSILPPGLNLLSNSLLPPNFTPGSTVLGGAPSTAGNYDFTLIATDSLGHQVASTFSLHVSAINILSGTLMTPVTGVAYSQQFTAVGGTAPYTFSASPLSLTEEMLPPGITLSASGLLAGTPTSTGPYEFRLTVQDGIGNTFSRSYGLTATNSFGLAVEGTNPGDITAGMGVAESLSTSGTSTYTWSVVSGTLPAGQSLVSGSVLGAPASSTYVVGQATTPGVYVATLRATDNANASNFADHRFTARISPMELVVPVPESLAFHALPVAHVGTPFSFTYKVAGGTPPYTFAESPYVPLPAGLTLSPGGVLSGTPLAIGNYSISLLVTDSVGNQLNGVGGAFIVAAAGVAPPLVSSTSSWSLAPGSTGIAAALDRTLQTGTPPYAWSVAAGSSLPPGLTLLPGSNGVSTSIGGMPTTPGNYSFSLNVSDGSGQSLTVGFNETISAISLTPDALVPGIVGTPYSVSIAPAGGTPPYTFQAAPYYDMPVGLTLNSSGLLSGTPAYPGSYLVSITVTDSASHSFNNIYELTVDDPAGQVPGLIVTPSPIQVFYVQGSPAPGPIPISVNTTTGAIPFELSVAGLTGSSLSSSNGSTPASVNLNLSVTGLPLGTSVGAVGVRAPTAVDGYKSLPVIVTVTAVAPCTYTLNPSAGSSPSSGGTGSFSVSTASACSWTAVASDTTWITITSGASGTGSGTVSYTIAANGTGSARNGTITINGQIYSITQFGSGCSFAINPANLQVTSAGGMATIAITASSSICSWTATGLGATPGAGASNGSVTVTIPPNTTASTQTLMATIAGQTLTVTETGANCTVSLGSNSATISFAGGGGSVTVNTLAGCSYSTVTGPSWISITSGGSGSGPGTLVYSAAPNSTTVSRSGTITIGGQPFQITEQPLSCSVSLDASGLGSPYGSAGGTGLIAVTTNGSNCSWTASSGATWATLSPSSGTGNGTIGVTASSNASSVSPRSTAITILGQSVNVVQSGTTCSYTLQSANGTVPASGGTGSVGVIAPSVCGWTAVSNNPSWLTISSSGNGGSSNVVFVAAPNLSASPQIGTLTIAGQTYTVTQAAASCSYSLGAPNTTIAYTAVNNESLSFSTTFSGCSPSAMSYASWLTVSTSFTGSSGTVTYSVTMNSSAATRVGTIQIGDQTFTVNQSGAACAFSLNAYGAVFNRVRCTIVNRFWDRSQQWAARRPSGRISRAS